MVMMRFNERKATQAAAYLLQMRGGKMSYMKLIKLLYLADRAALVRFGRPITTDRYVSMDRGPVLSRVLDLATDGDIPGQELIWGAAISEPKSNYEVSLREDPGDDELSEAEVGVLEEIFERFGRMSRWELVDVAHACRNGKIPKAARSRLATETSLKLKVSLKTRSQRSKKRFAVSQRRKRCSESAETRWPHWARLSCCSSRGSKPSTFGS